MNHNSQVEMPDNDRVVARPTRQSPIATFGLRLMRYHKMQLGKIHVTINSIHSVYGGLPIGESALRVGGFAHHSALQVLRRTQHEQLRDAAETHSLP